MVLRGGDITVPFHESRLNWVHDLAPPLSCRMESTNTVPRSDSSDNSSVFVPRNTRAPIPSDSLHNSSVSVSSAPFPNDSMCSYPKHVPERKKSENEVSAIAMCGSSAAPLSPAPPKKCRIRRRRQARRPSDPGCTLGQSARSRSSRSDPDTARGQRPHINQEDGSVPAFPDCR